MRTLLLFTTVLVLFTNPKANAQCAVSVAPVAAYGGTATYVIGQGGNLGPFQVCNGATVYDTMLSTQRRWYLQPGSVLNLKNTYNHVVYMKGNSTLNNLGGPGTVTVYKESISVVNGIPSVTSCSAVSFPTITCPTPTFTGVEDLTLNLQLNIFPNPAGTSVNFETGNSNPSTITLSNGLGIKVKEIVIENGSGTMNVNNLAEGIYFVTVSSSNRSTIKKLVITR